VTALFRRYAEWLVSISWKRFLLSILLLIVAGILSNIPPFTWTSQQDDARAASRNVESRSTRTAYASRQARQREGSGSSSTSAAYRSAAGESGVGQAGGEIIIDQHGAEIRRDPRSRPT